MSIVITSTPTAWTRTAQQICTDALQHLSVLGSGETASSADMQLALGALDTVLKELPLSGYAWPQLSGEVGLTFAAGQTMDLPDDYYAYPVAWKTVNGQQSPLTQIAHAAWVQMPNRAATGDAVTHFYISPAGQFYTWPVVAVDPVITLQYQRVVSDASATASTDLPQYWIGPLGYGVANELALKYGIPQATRVEIAQRWAAKRDKALESSIASEVIEFGVRD
jgi:hypothetical protein